MCHVVTPLPRADPLADRERNEEFAALDAAAAAAEVPLRPEGVAVGPRVARQQRLRQVLFAMMGKEISETIFRCSLDPSNFLEQKFSKTHAWFMPRASGNVTSKRHKSFVRQLFYPYFQL